QRLVGAGVGGGDVLEADLAGQPLDLVRLGGVGDVLLGVHDVQDPFTGRRGLGDPARVLRQVTHRLEGALEVLDEHDELTGGDVPAHHRPAADEQHDGGRDAHE